MKITIVIQRNEDPNHTTVEVKLGSEAANLPAMQLQDGLVDISAKLLDAIMNTAQQKGIVDPERILKEITLADIGPMGIEILDSAIPNQPNNK